MNISDRQLTAKIFMNKLMILKSRLDPFDDVSAGLDDETTTAFDEFWNDVYPRLQECWTIAEKMDQISRLSLEIFSLDPDTSGID